MAQQQAQTSCPDMKCVSMAMLALFLGAQLAIMYAYSLYK